MLKRIYPFIGLFVLLGLACWLGYNNGLYGQDAHEYLRQCRGFMDRLGGLPAPAPTRGDSEFGAGFPLLGAILGMLWGKNAILGLQWATWATAAGAAYFFDASNRLLQPGAKRLSYGWWCGIFVSAPLFLRAGVTSMSDMPALCFLLGCVFYSCRYDDRYRAFDLVLAVFCGSLAVLMRTAALAAVVPMLVWGVYRAFEKRRFFAVFLSIMPILVVYGVHVWARAPLQMAAAYPSVIHDWSIWHLFMRHFATAQGAVGYGLPNGLHVWSVVCHFGFFPMLPIVFLLFKKTDLHLPDRRIVLAAFALYGLLVAGLPVQSPRYLLPLWGLMLLVLFPAFDRVVSYGLYFIPKVVSWLLGIAIVFQLAGWVYYARPIVARQRMEQHLAQYLQKNLPPDAVVYSMDVDIALKNYLPTMRFANIWEREYAQFGDNAYFLFHKTRFSQQWQGQNPVKNLERALPLLQGTVEVLDGWEIGAVVE
jgi:hypothetical protein